jgi:hypothetical protein
LVFLLLLLRREEQKKNRGSALNQTAWHERNYC